MTAEHVQKWVDTALIELRDTGMAQIDLDDLLHDEPPLAVQGGLDCLQHAITAARRVNPNVDGILTIPLQESFTLSLESPTLDELLTEPWEYGPGRSVPGLYLARPVEWAGFESGEDYRRSLRTEHGLPTGYSAYYRTWLTDDHAQLGWPYDRTVYIHTVGT